MSTSKEEVIYNKRGRKIFWTDAQRYVKSLLILTLIQSCMVVTSKSQAVEKDVKHIKVYYEKGRYGGWPANHGIWSWDNEILVGFLKGYYEDRGAKSHNMNPKKHQASSLARSLDGGETWAIQDAGIGLDFPDCSTAMNFNHPDFALTVRRNGWNSGIYHSYDRGKTWSGPCPLPNFDLPGLAGRTDYLVNSEHEALVFLTAAKSDGEEGKVISIKTIDGGKSWSFLSSIGPEPAGYSIMPATVRLSDRELLTTIRRREGDHSFIETYHSTDNGSTWKYLSDAVNDTGVGNPPAMVRMKDGRICLVYGYRAEEEEIKNKTKTSDIRAKLSNDNGRTWSREYILRNDGSGRDLGYPRVVQRADGKIVAVYYFMDKVTGPERYIAATIWEVPDK